MTAQCETIPEPLEFISPEESNIIEDSLPLVLMAPFGDPAGACYVAVGVDGCGRFMVAWGVDGYPKDEVLNHGEAVVIQRILPTGVLSGVWQPLTADLPAPVLSLPQEHLSPSIAISPIANVRVSWIASCPDCQTHDPDSGPFNVSGILRSADFAFNDSPPITTAPYPEPTDYSHHDPSVGRSDLGFARSAWTSNNEGDLGVLEGVSVASANEVRPCGAICFTSRWQPALAMRPNGDFCIAWAEAEEPLNPQSYFNIAMRVYDASGTLIDEVAGPSAASINPVS